MAVQISGNDITVPRDGSFTRNVTIGGTLTYEDVTNIDSVGLVTARTGIEIGARPGVAASISVDGNMIVSGISTFNSRVLLGTTTEGEANADDLTIAGSGHVGITIRAGTTSQSAIYMSDATSGGGEYVGNIIYDHSDNHMRFATAETERLRITSSGFIQYAPSNMQIFADSSDGSDDHYLNLSGGGACAQTRGAQVVMYGNEKSSEQGRLLLMAGNSGSANGSIDFYTGGANRGRIDSSGVALIGSGAIATPKITGPGGLDVSQYALSICMGGSSGSNGQARANSTTKEARLVIPHYTNAEEPVTCIYAYSQSDKNVLNIGGGTGLGNNATEIYFNAAANTTTTGGSERMRITSGGLLNIGATTSDSSTDFLNIQQPQAAGHESVHLTAQASSSFSGSSVLKCVLHGFYRQSYGSNGFLFKNADDQANNRGVRVHQYQNSASSVVGSIFYNSSSTDFNTSSDYRLKENEVLISDGITRLKQLKPYRFNFKNVPSETVDGFFAHEVASVVPHAVGGEKDEMKPNAWYQEGDTIPSGKAVGDVKGYSSTEMEIQQLDYSKLVTVTIAALQESITKIETLETEVSDLKTLIKNSSSFAALKASL